MNVEESLRLLWRDRDQPVRKTKSGLSVDRIIATAIEIADAEGLPALSIRRVADKLKVGAMSLYTYVPGKAELTDLMHDSVLKEVGPSTGDTWRARLEHVAKQNWDLYHRHPWLLMIESARPPLGPGVTAKYEYELQAIEGIGLSDVEMDSVLTLVLGFVSGTVRGSVHLQETERLSGMTDTEWWEAHAPYLEKVMGDDASYPIASRVGQAAGEAYNGVWDPNHLFQFGLQRILDGVEVLLQR